ncbi:MAG: family 10 glycosylhydrolase [Chloroflexi bacterium]|nr:family 10 glycosylhydrolase [Chloroflexota bacterium]
MPAELPPTVRSLASLTKRPWLAALLVLSLILATTTISPWGTVVGPLALQEELGADQEPSPGPTWPPVPTDTPQATLTASTTDGSRYGGVAVPTYTPQATLTASPTATVTSTPVAPPATATATRIIPTATPTPMAPTAVPRASGEEFRAIWVDAFHDGFKTPAQVDKLVQEAGSAGFNAIFLQVRARGDSYYNQSLEPRAEDKNFAPGFDALAYTIAKAHQANPRLEVHAWLVVMPVWSSRLAPPKSPNHVYNLHGPRAQGSANWMTATYKGKPGDYLDPGHPDAAEYLANVCLSVVRNYDVDGIHLDFIRYPGIEWGYNQVSLDRYNSRYGTSGRPQPNDRRWQQWRRDQVTALVRRIWLGVVATKPKVKVSAATIPWGNPPVRETDWANTRAYQEVFQDWRAWLQEGILDFAVPMCYFQDNLSQRKAAYDLWIEWSKNHRYNRQVVIGVGAYLNTIANTLNQMRRAQAASAMGNYASGLSIYSYAVTNTENRWTGKPAVPNGEFLKALTQSTSYNPGGSPVFQARARVPAMPWKEQPTRGHIRGAVKARDGRGLDGATVSVSGPANVSVTSDGNGYFGFVDLPPGQYVLTAALPGYRTGGVDAPVNAGAVTTLSLILNPN